MASFPVFYAEDDDTPRENPDNNIRVMIAKEVKKAVYSTWPSHKDLSPKLSEKTNPRSNFKSDQVNADLQCINCMRTGHLIEKCRAPPQNSALAAHMSKTHRANPPKKPSSKLPPNTKIAAIADIADCKASGGGKEDFYG
jgi:hypothetical protein